MRVEPFILCSACVDVATHLSAALRAGFEDPSSSDSIRHKLSAEDNFSRNNECSMCAFLTSRCALSERRSKEKLVLDLKPIWVREDTHALRQTEDGNVFFDIFILLSNLQMLR